MRQISQQLLQIVENEMNKITILVLLLAALITAEANACKRSANRANVTAIDGGVFYARSLPAASVGSEGKTDIYFVDVNGDKVVDSYNWFNSNQLVLAWSPIVGEVAVLKYDPENEDAALAFYIGGVFLKSYSHAELMKLGVRSINKYCGVHLGLKILGQEQMPNTNDYVFKIEFESSGIKMFDITTGNLFSK